MLNCNYVSRASKTTKLMLAGSALLIAGAMSSLVLAPPAQSRQTETLKQSSTVQTVIDATSSGGDSDALLLNGTPVRIDRIWSVYEGRRLELDKLLSNNIMHGNLTSEQAIGFRKELERIAESLYRFTNADTLTNERAVDLANQLESVSERISASLNVEPLPRLIVVDDTTGEGLLISDFFGSVVAPSAEDVRGFKTALRDGHSRITTSIAVGQGMGALHPTQATSMLKELDSLSQLEKSLDDIEYPRYSDLMKLAINYDSIRGRLGQLMNSNSMQPLVREAAVVVTDGAAGSKVNGAVRSRAAIEQRISLGLIKGQLTRAEADALRQMLSQLSATEESFRKNTGRLTPQQQRHLESGLNRIAGAVDSAISL